MMNSTKIKKIYSVCLGIVAVTLIFGIYLCGRKDLELMSIKYARNIAVDTMGMLVGGVLLISLYAGDKEDKKNHSMFRMIYVLDMLFFMDIFSAFIEGNSAYVIGIKVVNTLLFISEDLLVYIYWTYIRNELSIEGNILRVTNIISRAAVGINIILDIINIKFGFYFKVSNEGEYIDSRFEYMGDIAIIAIFVMALIAIIRVKDKKLNEKLILASFITFPLSAYILGGIRLEYFWVYPGYLLSVLLIYIRIFFERDKKLAEQQVMLTKQSTALMISQIQPHFLYNVLTTISNLCVSDPEEAEETTVLFSQYLRTNLDSLRNQEPVPFATEFGHIRTYVELEKKRFGDILNVEYDINEQNFKVPSLGLQPIVENSIKHGIRGKNAPGHIKLGTYKVEGGYQIIIEDDGIGFDMNMPPKEDGRSHVGMINVRERLKQMCNATMHIESSPGNGCRTEIFVPGE